VEFEEAAQQQKRAEEVRTTVGRIGNWLRQLLDILLRILYVRCSPQKTDPKEKLGLGQKEGRQNAKEYIYI
jgi:hypothetical protein